MLVVVGEIVCLLTIYNMVMEGSGLSARKGSDLNRVLQVKQSFFLSTMVTITGYLYPAIVRLLANLPSNTDILNGLKLSSVPVYITILIVVIHLIPGLWLLYL